MRRIIEGYCGTAFFPTENGAQYLTSRRLPMPSPHQQKENKMLEVILFTNRNIIVFREGKQDTVLQGAVNCYDIDQPLLDLLLLSSATYSIAKWREWRHDISRQEFEYLLGQRTREKDIADLESKKAG